MASKTKTIKKQNCQVKTNLGCNNQGVRHMTGMLKGDPKFHICLGCWAYLRRQGVRMKEVK